MFLIKRLCDNDLLVKNVFVEICRSMNGKNAEVCERFVKYAFCDTIFREFVRETCYNHITVEFGEEFDKENL